MSQVTCRASQKLANQAVEAILEDKDSIFEVDEISINRMLVCGKCPKSNVDSGRAKQAFRSSISTLANKINRYDEWGYNPEVTKKNRAEGKRKYQNEHKEVIRGQGKSRAVNKRIALLKAKIGG